jgi:hypothetical protein
MQGENGGGVYRRLSSKKKEPVERRDAILQKEQQ